MMTQKQLKDNIAKAFSEEIKLHLLSEKKLLDFMQRQLLENSKPNCFSCFDKGFTVKNPTLPGEAPGILYCPCAFGQSLRDLISANYNPKI